MRKIFVRKMGKILKSFEMMWVLTKQECFWGPTYENPKKFIPKFHCLLSFFIIVDSMGGTTTRTGSWQKVHHSRLHRSHSSKWFQYTGSPLQWSVVSRKYIFSTYLAYLLMGEMVKVRGQGWTYLLIISVQISERGLLWILTEHFNPTINT